MLLAYFTYIFSNNLNTTQIILIIVGILGVLKGIIRFFKYVL